MERPVRNVAIGAGIIFLLAFVWFSRRVLLLAFSGMLIALIFTSILNQVRRFLPIRQGIGVGLLLLTFAGLGSLVGYLLAPGLISQFSELADRLPKTLQALADQAQSTEAYRRVHEMVPDLQQIAPESSGVLSRVTSLFASTFDTVAGLILLIFVALFLAVNPSLYRGLVLRLVPRPYRDDGNQILARLICTLKFWLLGQFISMCIIGLLVGVSFALAGLPLATSLAVLAGLGEFVPFVGPFIAAMPALLLALSISGKLFAIILAIYLGIQFIEGHFIMPMVQRHTVDLPPVLTLLAIFFMGNAFGLLGMFVAAPLMAVTLVLVEEIYIRRYLGESERLLDADS